MTSCACSQVPGKLINPRLSGLRGFGVTTATPVVLVATKVPTPPPVVLTAAQATAALATTKPTPAQAVALIKQLRPPVTGFKTNVPVPKIVNGKASSNLSGLYSAQRAMAFGGLGASQTSTAISSAAAGAAAGAALGTVVPGIGNIIGGAVGAIVGLVGGLFGHKAALPHVTSADVAQAQTWMQQYTQVAGSVIGRGFTQTAIQDMLTAEAILDPNFWGRGTSTNLVIPAITNFYNEVMTRLGDFFSAMQAVPVGANVTLYDDASIPGHGKTNMAISYSFANPGVNAPSYVLGPIFAQYFYVMCTIYQSPTNCSGHLAAPIPQMYTDVLDWFRSSHPQWDTPQPNVVTGTDLSIAAPAAPNVPQTAAVTGPQPMLSQTSQMMPTGQIAPGVPAVSFAPGSVPVPTSPNATGIYSPQPGGAYAATPPGSGAYVSTLPSTASTSALTQPVLAGLNWIEIGLIALVAIPMLMGKKSGSH